MKLFIHAHAYPDFLEAVYRERPELAGLDYDGQFDAIDRESHISANAAWADALRPFGYEVMVVISNNERIQRTWAVEHGVNYRSDSWQTEIAEAQVSWFRPDVLFFTSYEGLRPEWIERLRETNLGIELIMLWCGMPFASNEIFGHFDLVLTCVPEIEERFRSLGCHSRHLHHAFDPRVLGHLDVAEETDIPLSFVGQLIRGTEYHETRVRQLESIAQRIGINIYSSSYELYATQKEPGTARRLAYSMVERLRDVEAIGRLPLGRKAARAAGLSTPAASEALRSHTRPAVYGLAMYRILQRSRVSYNSHIDTSLLSLNMRLFEATGVGSCLLTDYKPNLSTLFEPDRDVVTSLARRTVSRRRSGSSTTPESGAISHVQGSAAHWPSTPTPSVRANSTRSSGAPSNARVGQGLMGDEQRSIPPARERHRDLLQPRAIRRRLPGEDPCAVLPQLRTDRGRRLLEGRHRHDHPEVAGPNRDEVHAGRARRKPGRLPDDERRALSRGRRLRHRKARRTTRGSRTSSQGRWSTWRACPRQRGSCTAMQNEWTWPGTCSRKRSSRTSATSVSHRRAIFSSRCSSATSSLPY